MRGQKHQISKQLYLGDPHTREESSLYVNFGRCHQWTFPCRHRGYRRHTWGLKCFNNKIIILSEIVQVTEVYVNRTRNLLIDESPSPSPSPSPTPFQMEKPRVKIPSTSRGQSPVSPGCLKRGPAHEASHLRTRSPRHLPGRSSKTVLSRDHTPLDQRQARPLQEQFRAFSLHGDRRGSGTQLTLRNSTMLKLMWGGGTLFYCVFFLTSEIDFYFC